jgi:hypothetical protein
MPLRAVPAPGFGLFSSWRTFHTSGGSPSRVTEAWQMLAAWVRVEEPCCVSYCQLATVQIYVLDRSPTVSQESPSCHRPSFCFGHGLC